MENNTIQKLVDITGLTIYHEKLKTDVLSKKQDVIEDLDSIRSKANAAAGDAERALTDAKAYVDSKVDGKFDAAGTAAGFNDAMDERVKALEKIDHEQLAADASAAAVAAIVAGAESDFDTLKDVADWIDSHKEGAAELQITVSGHTESIDALETDKQDVIKDLETIRLGAAAGATALQSVPEEYITETELASKGYLTNDNFGFATDADIDGLFA